MVWFEVKKNKATKQKESDTINIGVTGTKEDFEKAIKEISEKAPVVDTVTFCTEDDTEITKKNKDRKTKYISKEPIDTIKFAGDE